MWSLVKCKNHKTFICLSIYYISVYPSVETVSEGHISEPTTAQYRTVPLRPHNVTFDAENIGPYSFTVKWSGPAGISEFDRYQVAIGIRRKTPQIIGKRDKTDKVFIIQRDCKRI